MLDIPTPPSPEYKAYRHATQRSVIINGKAWFPGGGGQLGLRRETNGSTLTIFIVLTPRASRAPLYNGVKMVPLNRTIPVPPDINRLIVLTPTGHTLQTFTFPTS